MGVIRKEKAYNWCFCHSSLKVENNHYFKSRKQSGLVQNSAAPSPLRSADSVETFTMVRAYRLLEQKENVRGHLNTSAKAFMPNWTLQSYPLSTYADAASNLRCWPLLQTSDNGFSAQCTTDCFCFSKEPTTTVCGTFLALWPALPNKSRLYISSWKHCLLASSEHEQQHRFHIMWSNFSRSFTQCIRHGGHKINSNKSLQARKLETNSEHLNNLSLLPHAQHNCL